MVVRGLRGMKDGMSTLAEPAMGGEMLDEEELRPPTLDDYPVGSIVRMKLKDFLTYSHVEFECGPVGSEAEVGLLFDDNDWLALPAMPSPSTLFLGRMEGSY